MSTGTPPPLDPKLSSLLSELRGRVRRYITWESLLALGVVVLGAFWLGFLVDWVPVRMGGTEMPRSARYVFLAGTVFVALVVLVRYFVLRIARRLPNESLALLLERVHPHLAGRLITAVQLTRRRQVGDIYADALLDEVRSQALSAVDQVETRRVLRSGPLWRKGALLLPLLTAAIVLGVLRPDAMVLAAKRLTLLTDNPWPRLAELRMVGLEVPLVSAEETKQSDAVRLLPFTDKLAKVARGSGANLRIEAKADGATLPEICTVYYRTESGVRGQVNMRRVGRVRDGYQAFSLEGPPLSGITEDIELTIRGLDDRLDDYRIEAVDAPNITELAVEATYPEYLREPEAAGPDLVTRYQPGLRIREGTTVRLVGTSSTPIDRVQAAVSQGDDGAQPVPVEVSADGLQFELALVDVRQPTAVVMVPFDADEISAPSPYRYFLGVVSDAAPEVELRMPGIGTAVTPNVRMPIEGMASDDYGVTELSVQLATAGEAVETLHTVEASVDREGEYDAVIDVRDLANAGDMPRPQPGDVWNVFAEARDAYDLGAPHEARTEFMRLEVVKPEDLLAVLERRELGLRARLEQTISEVDQLRETLDLLRREGWEPQLNLTGGEVSGRLELFKSADLVSALQDADADAEIGAAEDASEDENGEPERLRAVQLLQLRIQQAGLQAAKSSDELSGIAEAIDRILLEMTNNRVDTPDRSQRMASGVRDPLRRTVEGALSKLRTEIEAMLSSADDPQRGPGEAARALESCQQVLLELSAVLEKMLDLESYNEVLDLVRGLIDQQEALIESTKEEQGRSLQDLFK